MSARDRPGRRWRSFVVEAGLEDHKVVAVNEIDQAMLLTDAAGPSTGKHVAQWLWLADARGRSRRASSINRLMRFNVARLAASQ